MYTYDAREEKAIVQRLRSVVERENLFAVLREANDSLDDAGCGILGAAHLLVQELEKTALPCLGNLLYGAVGEEGSTASLENLRRGGQGVELARCGAEGRVVWCRRSRSRSGRASG